MKRIYIAALTGMAVLISLSAAGPKPKKAKAPKGEKLEKIKKNHLAASKKTVQETTKKGTITKTIYIVDPYYSKFEDGLYAEFNTDAGKIICKLHFDKVPLTVCNFVALAEGNMPNKAKAAGEPFYDGLKFHRVITKANGDGQDFMIQGGDPQGDGSGGPGYQFEDEFSPELTHEGAGVLSMANSGPGTNGSQFFITVASTHWLDNHHSIFGRVVEGMDVLNKVRTNTAMQTVKIIRKGNAALDFAADSASFAGMRESIRKAKDFASDQAEVLKRYPNAKMTSSGLWYVVNAEGNGKQVADGDKMTMHIIGKLSSGTEFDNTYKTGNPVTLGAGSITGIKGLNEGLFLMHEGAKYTFIIPSSLGFGERGAGKEIPANSSLIFEVDMLSVQAPDPNSDFATNAAEVLKRYPTAQKTESGLWYVIQKMGDGMQAEPGMQVEVNYKGMLADGSAFDSSYGKKPLPFKLGVGAVIPGWDEGVGLMKVGSKFLLIIPSSLGYGEGGFPPVIPPGSTLVFETELVSAKP